MDLIISKEQQQAIDCLEGPSLIIAGAGTGKTTVLTEKIKKIVVSKKVSPERVLALTFTEKAAHEMETRVDQALPLGYFQTWVMTFHGFADILLREHGIHIGLSPSYQILSEAESVLFLRQHLSEFSVDYFFSTGNPTGFIDNALKHFSRLRDENITTEEYRLYATKLVKKATNEEEQLEAQKTTELAKLYQQFEQLKLKHSYLDYGDLIFYLLALLKKRPNILKKLRQQFLYCLVDEFQDTNIVQYELLKALYPTKEKSNLTVIGDDNQSIYKFRGASVSNILSFTADYHNSRTFVLNTNYRSYQEILDSSYCLITHNNPDTLEARLGINKKLVSSRGSKKQALPELLVGSDDEQEADNIVKTINKLTKKEPDLNLNEIAILVRAASHAKPIIQALERHGIPYQFLGPTLLYYKPEIRDLIALLKFLQHSQDSASLMRVLSMSIFALDRSELVYLLSFAKRTSRSLMESLVILKQLYGGVDDPELTQYRKNIPYLKAKTRDKLLKLEALLIDLIQKTGKLSATATLYRFLEKSGYLKILAEVKSEAQEERLHNITRFFNRLKKIPGQYGEPTVNEVIEHIDLSLELGDSPRAEDFDFEKEQAVNILTAHSAKGLEFKVVFMGSLTHDRFPTRRRGEALPIPEALIKEKLPQGDFHVQEERRLFYVAMTRAKDRLYFTFAKQYLGNKRPKKISPFVVEALGKKQVEHIFGLKQSQEQQLSIFELSKQISSFKKPNQKPVEYGINQFSYSQIEAYDRCPKLYEYRYLLRVPEPESSALSFGSSIHRSLELFYKEVINGQKVNLNILLNYYQRSFLPFGYLSKALQERTFKHGQKLLTNYFNQYFQPQKKILATEKRFRLKLKDEDNEYLLTGVIDRLDQDKDSYEIIDYKTGKMPVESALRNSLQLGIYALAASSKDFLNVPLDKIKLTYYYLEQGKRFEVQTNQSKVEKTKIKVLTTLSKLTAGDFTPNPGFHCDFCPFKIICPAWET